MKTTTQALILILAILIYPPQAISQDLIARAQILLEKGKYERAIRISRQAVQEAEQVYGSNSRKAIDAKWYLGRVLHKSQMYAQAHEKMTEAMDKFLALPETSDSLKAAWLMEYGIVKIEIHHHLAAKTWLLKAATFAATSGQQKIHADILTQLARNSRLSGKSVEASSYMESALAGYSEILPADHSGWFMPLCESAAIFEDQGESLRAQKEIRKALEIADQQPMAPLSMADFLVQMGEVMFQKKQYNQAEPILFRAQELLDEHLGPHHDRSVALLKQRAEMASFQRHWCMAAERYRDLLGNGQYGRNNPIATAAAHANLGVALIHMHDYTDAERAWLKSLKHYQLVLAEDHEYILHVYRELLELYRLTGNRDKEIFILARLDRLEGMARR
ncbi:tetratricopeptide repeat protein [Pontibacter sp. G13]|uniref:tetratricopeptide repeat protein n=1 Tax=Pontibacter sp. G13 TaxID=3074898 RepID=UPI00288BF77D|nr:tetratricopeptide repeat protein [Pontibacter sp. G13]WNJ16556.1 tetratricopeptide repeat protein [Pontibacter sp. G13]